MFRGKFLLFVYFVGLLTLANAYHKILLTRKVKNIKKFSESLRSKSYHQAPSSPSITLTNFLQVQYFGTVYVGIPRQRFEVLFDTGSDLFWVPGPQDNDSCGKSHRKFDPSKSRTYVNLNKSLEICYMKGDNNLELVNETVTLGRYTIKNSTIGLVTSGDCEYQQFDGLMGMSFRAYRNHTLPIIPMFENMVDQHLVPTPVFSFYIRREEGEGRGGHLYLGGYDSTLINSEMIKRLPVLAYPLPYWIISINKISIDTKLVAISPKAILDTGTSIILAPENSVKILENATRGAILQGVLTVDCSKINLIPPIIFNIGGIDYRFSMEELLLADIDGMCALGIGIQGNVGIPNTWVLGDSFLVKVYSIYDYAAKKIALVPLGDSAGSTSFSIAVLVTIVFIRFIFCAC